VPHVIRWQLLAVIVNNSNQHGVIRIADIHGQYVPTDAMPTLELRLQAATGSHRTAKNPIKPHNTVKSEQTHHVHLWLIHSCRTKFLDPFPASAGRLYW
jgi:hypothetical protein